MKVYIGVPKSVGPCVCDRCVSILQVPVYKTVIATDVAVKNRDAVVYSTVVDIQTKPITSTVVETTTEVLTKVSV